MCISVVAFTAQLARPSLCSPVARRPPSSRRSLLCELRQEAAGGRENTAPLLGELRLSSFMAIPDSCAAAGTRGSSKPSVPAALGQSVFWRKTSLPRNTDPKIPCLRAWHPSFLLWDRGTWQPQLPFAHHRAEGWC